MGKEEFKSFAEFYPYYLAEHSDATSRKLHYIGTSLAMGLLIYALVTGSWALLIAVPVAGYLFAWIGHMVFEKNKPATFRYPFWSLLGDFRMYFEAIASLLKSERK
ncbi:MAG: DUF962 domain-containing protein [Pseudomonadota bacterium]